jgi:hypothetical protein
MTLLRYTMLPAPARIAAPPRVTSRVSWNPAVPPPPVSGAAVGKALADWVGVGVGVGVAEGVGVAGLLAEALADALALLPDGEAVAVPVDRPAGVAVLVPVGEPPGANDVGVPEGVPPLQAETDADASTAAHPIAINLPLSRVPAMAERIFIGPPRASAGA